MDDVKSLQENAVSAAGKGGGSIAERRAAKFGFNAERINTARFRTTSPLASPAASLRSPCLTIPPGISPTALLDSPIMLHNYQALPSPTTGTFQLPHLNHDNSVTPADRDWGNNFSSSFSFKHLEGTNYLPGFSSSENQGIGVDYGSLVPAQAPIDCEFPAEFQREAIIKNCFADESTDVKILNSMIVNPNSSDSQICHSDVGSYQIPQHKESIHGEDVGKNHLLGGDQKDTCPSMGMIRTSEDGYNWRKYGQKQVKGSEYPRSYYKCTHPNCQVKKKVERSLDGQITEIIYKGGHNHPKPQPSRRAVLGSGSSCNDLSEMGEGSKTCVNVEGGSLWRNIQSDWRADGLERTSSTSVVTEVSDPFSHTQRKSVGAIESAETPELSSTLASQDDEEDEATQGSISLRDDADDEESESKRRKKESCLIETNLASRAVREPRVVVQIESEVDILDDGYRWRKYGQKVVKGNPNPRSYYKCTSAGCSVRKHVERASHNLKCVITTYEGKHNHEVPAARNSSHANSSGGNLPPAAANSQQTLTLPRSTSIPKPNIGVRDLAAQFDTKPEFNSGHLRPSLLGNFGNEMKFGASSMFQMKFPSLQNTMSYGSFGLNPRQGATHQAGSVTHFVPDFPISLPSNLHQSANFSLAGFGFSNHGKPFAPVQSFLSGQQQQQQLKENDMRFLRPKQEQKDDNLYDACLPINDHANASLSSSSSLVYSQAMGSFPP